MSDHVWGLDAWAEKFSAALRDEQNRLRREARKEPRRNTAQETI